MHHKESRATLGGKLSAVLVAAGSSVGLGNIWRFPYVAGDNGGGAFLIIYILCVLLLGLPLMIAEFTVGRASHRNAVGAYRALNPRWRFLGYNGVLAAFLILGFYFVVSGWTAEYMVHSVTGSIARFSTAEQYKSLFENFISNPWRPVVYTCLFVLATHFVIAMGVQKGIERSAKILMPLLFLILSVSAVHSLPMPGGEAGLKFLFAPDFSMVAPTTVLVALGQAFFSLSVAGNGSVIYGSYLPKNENLPGSARNVAVFDTLAALLAAFVIIPAMAAGGAPLEKGGPGLMFVWLVTVLNGMPGGRIIGVIFFVCVLFAGLSSIINLYEAPVATLQDTLKLKRVPATAIILVIGCGIAILIQKITSEGMDVVSIYICPLGALLAGIMFFWVAGKKFVLDEVNDCLQKPIGGWFYPLAKYVYCILCIVALVAGAALGGIG